MSPRNRTVPGPWFVLVALLAALLPARAPAQGLADAGLLGTGAGDLFQTEPGAKADPGSFCGATLDPCLARFTSVCEQATGWGDVVARSSRGGLFPNPWLSPGAMVRLAGLEEDRAVVEGEHLPAFRALHETLTEWIRALPAGTPGRDEMLSQAGDLTLSVGHWQRCEDLTRPFVANNQGGVGLCPYTTNMAPEIVFTVFAHELGHFVDPCRAKPPWPVLAQVPADRIDDCDADEEDFADLFGARLAAATLDDLPWLRERYMALTPDQRFVALAYFRFMPGPCEFAPRWQRAFVEPPAFRRLLGCEH